MFGAWAVEDSLGFGGALNWAFRMGEAGDIGNCCWGSELSAPTTFDVTEGVVAEIGVGVAVDTVVNIFERFAIAETDDKPEMDVIPETVDKPEMDVIPETDDKLEKVVIPDTDVNPEREVIPVFVDMGVIPVYDVITDIGVIDEIVVKELFDLTGVCCPLLLTGFVLFLVGVFCRGWTLDMVGILIKSGCGRTFIPS